VIDSGAELEDRLAAVRREVAEASERAGRDPSVVRLVAVTKGLPAELARWAVQAGVKDLGENYVTELAEKRADVEGATWHYVGVLQSHTARRVAELADVTHSLVPGRAAQRLSTRAHRDGRRMPCFVQVDFTGGRAGIDPDRVAGLVEEAADLPGIELRGLMTLPPMPRQPEDSRPYFRRLRELRDGLRERFPGLRELSMGMSADFRVAAEEGATMIRIGTALFGGRPAA